MHIVSDSFARAMKNKPYIVKLTLENQNVIQGEAIQEITFRGGTSGETEAFTLGGAVSGSVEITLNKTLVSIVEQGQRINVDLGMELETGMEWLPMGEYYVTEPTADDDILTVRVCDALAAKFDRSYEPVEGFDFDSDGGVDAVVFLKAICERRGVKVDVSNLEPVSLHTAPDGFTERQIIGFIAALYGGFAHVDRDGVLRIYTFRKTEQKVTPDDYYDGGMVKAEYTYSIQWIKCFNEITELTMIMGDTEAKQGIYLESIWMDNVILSNLWEQLQGFSYVPVNELSFFGNPLIDPGDIITVEDLSGTSHEVPVMGITHEYDGGIITKVAAYGQADATECTGSVSRQIQRVAVKAKTYSGMALEDAKKYADDLDRAMNQLEVLKRLTNETDDAIYMTEDGKLAFKATAILTGVLDAAIVTVKNLIATNIVAGILKSKDEKTFFLDLDNGILKLRASEFMAVVEGEAVLPPTLEDVSKILGSALFPELYPPQDYYDLDGDGVISDRDAALAMDMVKGQKKASYSPALKPTKVTIKIDPSDAESTISIFGKNMWGSDVAVSLGVDGSQIPIINGNCSVSGVFSVGDYAMIHSLSLSENENPKTLSWKDNGDGTFTLIGT